MTPRHAIAVLATALLAFSMSACAGSNPPAADAEATATSPEPFPSATPELSPTPTPGASVPAAVPTCDDISTTEFDESVTENGWTSWQLPYEGVGGSPFDAFTSGAPAGSISCRWGEDPTLATDNVIDLAWAPIGPDAASAAQRQLEAEGYERIETTEGVYLAMRGEDGWADEEGFAQAYLFTPDDVRWAMFKDELRFVQAPGEA
ncbi:hypothetical protein IF188_08155 [Microbacterium sp. NEAU-LLC]|uniref:Nitrate ABC transporter substrate-binding protein n=1 Tax=Microbacterium helvum TaxID=2773713 RepID=A0ABR8NLZ8_9MICO|nr:hypothetical protein [Microbacterium helvum]MBD3941664.1 hypothetical protein [Microbacterium helvum]